jgi:hypothetical protein
MGRNIIENLVAPLFTTIKIYFQKIRSKQILKDGQKYPHILGGRFWVNFVNGNAFGLLFICIFSFTFGDINIIIFLRCDYNGK